MKRGIIAGLVIIGFMSVGCGGGGSGVAKDLPRLLNLYFAEYGINQGDANTIYIEVENADSWTVTGVIPGNTITPSSGTENGTFALAYNSSANWGTETITLTATNKDGSVHTSDIFTVNAVTP